MELIRLINYAGIDNGAWGIETQNLSKSYKDHYCAQGDETDAPEDHIRPHIFVYYECLSSFCDDEQSKWLLENADITFDTLPKEPDSKILIFHI